MKKKLLINIFLIILVLFVTGCTKAEKEDSKTEKESRTMNYLMKKYVNIFNKADLKAAKDIFPDYYLEYSKDTMTQEILNQNKENNIKKYGDDFKVSYSILKETKLSEDELLELNNNIKETYNTDEMADECYKYQGTIVFDGKLYDEVKSLGTIIRCKYNNKFYIIRK